MKKLICTLIAILIIVNLSVPVYAANRDPLSLGVYNPYYPNELHFTWNNRLANVVYFYFNQTGRLEEYMAFTHDFDNGIYEKWEDGQKATDKVIREVPIIYMVIKGLNFSKEEFISANQLLADMIEAGTVAESEYSKESVFTDEEIDILYSDDLDAIREMFKHESAIIYNGKVYEFDEIFYAFDLGTLLYMRDNCELVEHIRTVLSFENGAGHDVTVSGKSKEYAELFVDALGRYPDSSPQTGFATVAYAAVAVVSAAAAVAVRKKRRR